MGWNSAVLGSGTTGPGTRGDRETCQPHCVCSTRCTAELAARSPLPAEQPSPPHAPCGRPHRRPRVHPCWGGSPGPGPEPVLGCGQCRGVGSAEQPHTTGVKILTRLFKGRLPSPPAFEVLPTPATEVPLHTSGPA